MKEKPSKGHLESTKGWGEWIVDLFSIGDVIEFGIDAVKIIGVCALAVAKFWHHFIR